jgi:chromate transporter
MPLIERSAVRETGWIDEREFTMAIGLGQVMPGPVMVVATFIGYRVAGLPGAAAGTLGVFLAPWALASLWARNLDRLAAHRIARGFRQGAAAAAVGLFAIAATSVARRSVEDWLHLVIAGAAVVLALRTKVHPGWILLAGALVGMAAGSPTP